VNLGTKLQQKFGICKILCKKKMSVLAQVICFA